MRIALWSIAWIVRPLTRPLPPPPLQHFVFFYKPWKKKKNAISQVTYTREKEIRKSLKDLCDLWRLKWNKMSKNMWACGGQPYELLRVQVIFVFFFLSGTTWGTNNVCLRPRLFCRSIRLQPLRIKNSVTNISLQNWKRNEWNEVA